MTTEILGGRLGLARRLARGEEGQTIVLLAVSLPLLLALLLLVIDGGRLLIHRERLQGAAQLAAYAGVSALAELPSGHQRDPDRARRSIDPVIREALVRNLPGTPFTYTFDMPFGDARTGGDLVVRLSSPFAASIQRITFGIGATGTVTTLPAPPTPTPAAFVPPAQVIRPSPRPSPTQVALIPLVTPSPRPTPTPAPTPWAPTVLSSTQLDRAPTEVVVAGRSVFATLPGPGNATGPGTLRTMDTGLESGSTSLQVAPYPYGVTVDAQRQRAYLAHVYPGRLSVVDTARNRVISEIRLPEHRLQKVALDVRAERLYVTTFPESAAAASRYDVLVFDTATNARVGTITLDRRPEVILVDSAHRRAYVHELFDNSITFVDTSANRVLRRIALPGRSGGIALDQGRDRIYSADAATGTVTVFEGATGRTIATFPVGVQAAASGITVDPGSGRVYVALNGPTRYDPATRSMVTENRLAAIDGLTGRLIGVAKMPGSSLSTTLTFDEGTKRLYYTQGPRLSVVTP